MRPGSAAETLTAGFGPGDRDRSVAGELRLQLPDRSHVSHIGLPGLTLPRQRSRPTQPEATGLVHYGPTDMRVVELVRLQEPGSGTAAQGAVLFIGRGCSICHGPTGAEGPGPHLTGTHTYSMRGTGSGYDALYEGGNFQGRGIKNFFSAPLVWSFINKAMPLQRQGHLTMDEVYSLTAYLLYLNDLVPLDATIDATSLPKVKMPARDRFVPDPRGGPKSVPKK